MNIADLVGEVVEFEGDEWVITSIGTKDGEQAIYLRELGEEGISVSIDELKEENPELFDKE